MELQVRWLFPVSSPPRENGVLRIESGIVHDFWTSGESASGSAGNLAVTPALVNAHTHLEFSELREPVGPARPFVDWIEGVIGHRRKRVGSSIDAGWREVTRGGTGWAGEIDTSDSYAQVAEQGLLKGGQIDRSRLVVFREILGLRSERIEGQVKLARSHVERIPRCGDRKNPRLVGGLSPHAPYSVHPELLRRIVDLGVETGAPLAMHVAETAGERELLEEGRGPFVGLLKKLGVWEEGLFGGRQILDVLRELARGRRGLVVHGNDLRAAEMEFIAANPQLSVIYCPRTHAYFGHGAHPWQRLLSMQVNVGLGTDSRASNPDLCLWNEVLFLRTRFPELNPAILLEMATRNGARALGIECMAGSISSGMPADLAVFRLPERDATDPYELLFDGETRLVGLLLGGAVAWGDGWGFRAG